MSCPNRDGIIEFQLAAREALTRATDEEKQDLNVVLRLCSEVLPKARRCPGYKGGRIETNDAMPVFAAVGAFEKKHPRLGKLSQN